MNVRRRPSGEPPPLPRQLDAAALVWAAVFGFWVLVWAWFFLFGGNELGAWITRRDLSLMAPIVENRPGWLTPAMRRINHFTEHLAVPVFGWTVIAGTVATRRFRHLAIHLATVGLIAVLWSLVAAEIRRPRPINVDVIGTWEGYAHPSRPIALITPILVALALSLIPFGAWRRRALLAVGVVLVTLATAQIYVGVEHPTDVFVSICMGVAISLFAFRILAPESVFPITYDGVRAAHLDVTGRRGHAIRRGMDRQLGLEVAALNRVGLAGSSGSTPIMVTLSDRSQVFAKLYASSHLRSDRWYKLGRTLRYGRLEDEHRFTSVRRLVGHEDHMLRFARDIGLPVPAPRGIVELTPDREYLLVMDFLDDAIEIGASTLGEATIDRGLAAVRTMWDHGMAHRDLKPANIMVGADGTVWLIDVAFGQIRPSPWRQAVDLANMMLVLALRSSPAVVHDRARLIFNDDELAEAFAASKGVTLPSELRRELRNSGRMLLTEFRNLVPERDPVRIQRWTSRRLALTAGVTVAAAFACLSAFGGLTDLGYFG